MDVGYRVMYRMELCLLTVKNRKTGCYDFSYHSFPTCTFLVSF